MTDLNGKHVVITGGSEGLGLAMARELLAHGAKVTAIARTAARLTVVERLGASVVAGPSGAAARAGATRATATHAACRPVRGV